MAKCTLAHIEAKNDLLANQITELMLKIGDGVVEDKPRAGHTGKTSDGKRWKLEDTTFFRESVP